MKVLLISALYPPFMLGGAENSARNLAEWLVGEGVEVGVIRAADSGETEGAEINDAGVRIYRVRTLHPYAPFRFPSAPSWKKPIYHLQDHFDPRIEAKVGKIFDQFAPDLVNIHMLQGVGYPVLRELSRRNIPVNYVLPDLGLACIRMNMFKGGSDCVRHCTLCRVSRDYKLGLIRKLKRIGFLSPSRSNIETLAKFFPVKEYPNAVIPNPNSYPKPTVARSESAVLRLLYAGRIHESKGVSMLLEAVERLISNGMEVTLQIAGHGPQEAELRARFERELWCDFLGFIPQSELANIMMNVDMLCIPSIWAENSPGVVIQALSVGLPVIGSNRGGIPELVLDGINGRIVHQQTVEDWSEALRKIVTGEELIDAWRANAAANAADFSQDGVGRRVLAWMCSIAEMPLVHDVN